MALSDGVHHFDGDIFLLAPHDASPDQIVALFPGKDIEQDLVIRGQEPTKAPVGGSILAARINVAFLSQCATTSTIRAQLTVSLRGRLVDLSTNDTFLRIGDKTMRRILFAIAAIASSSSLALAADIPAPVYQAPVFAPVMSWTGFYAGLNGGYTWGHQSVDPFVTSEACDNPLGCPQILALLSTGRKISSNSFTGGLQFGYNHQYGNVLFGLESDIDYLRLNGSFAYGPTRPSPQPITGAGTGSVTTSWVATFRPRFGWVADRLLVYVTGGLAFTDQHNRETSIVVVNGQIAGPIGSFDLSSSSNIGAVVGAGLEYAWTNQWSVKAEYLHFDFATVRAATGVIGGTGGFDGASMNANWHLTADTVRVGINYHFGGPVVAQY